jgi:colanic acid/amylovoran biosynthesis glycosyltransferase
MKKLILFTASYPLNFGEEFLATELEFLTKCFDVEIIPYSVSKITNNRAPKLNINYQLIKKLNILNIVLNLLMSLFSVKFYFTLYKEQKLSKSFGFYEFKRFISQYSKARIASKLIKYILSLQKVDVFYSYWLDFPVFAFYFVNKGNYKIISRAHGVDLYDDQNFKGYIPLQLQKINMVNKLFTSSEAGKSFIFSKYINKIKSGIICSKLGVKKLYNTISKHGSNNVCIISVSYCVEVKRIALIVDLISKIREFGVLVRWEHIGDGDLFEKIENYALSKLKYGFKLYGHKSNNEVQKILSENNYTAFISCTYSEGGMPVSMQEAQAYGIPIIATAVGGVPEVLANYDCGWLLDKDFDIERTAQMLVGDLQDKDLMQQKSINAYKSYLDKFQADKNYTKFCNMLLEL